MNKNPQWQRKAVLHVKSLNTIPIRCAVYWSRRYCILNIWLMWLRPNKNPSSKGHEIYKFDRPFLVHHYYILSLSEPRPGLEKKIFKKNDAFSPRDLYGHALAYKNPCPGYHKIFQFLVDTPLVIIATCIYFVWSLPGKRELIRKYIILTLFIPKLSPLEVGVMKFTISCCLTLHMLNTRIWLRFAQ